MISKDFFENIGKIFEKEPRLIQLPSEGKVVFVGDTHGDFGATELVIDRYLHSSYRIVFLGDYVDRGNKSKENINRLLQLKLEYPERIFLLAGNHEGYMTREFYPANFWHSLSIEEKENYGLIFSKFPLAATSQNGIIALHGGLPDLNSLEEVNQIKWGDEQWCRITWGDFVERDEDILGEWGGRPQFGGQYFKRLIDRYKKKILIRSHQPHAPLFMFDDRCITLFTSYAYLSIRTIAIADLEKEIQTAKDLELEKI